MGLRSGIRKKPIPDPEVKKAPDPGSGSAKQIVFVSNLCSYYRLGTDRPAQVQMQRDTGFREEYRKVGSV
jgi:hypothetical protein